MAVRSSAPVSLVADIVDEFAGSAPYALTSYYRGGSLVPNGPAANNSIPTSGAISLTNFLGSVNTQTTGNYTIGIAASFIGLGNSVFGFNANGQAGSFGTISTNTIDFSGFDVTIGGVYASSANLFFYVTSHVSDSGWISMAVGGTTYNRADAGFSQSNSAAFGGNYTLWTWNASSAIATSGTVTVSWTG